MLLVLLLLLGVLLPLLLLPLLRRVRVRLSPGLLRRVRVRLGPGVLRLLPPLILRAPDPPLLLRVPLRRAGRHRPGFANQALAVVAEGADDAAARREEADDRALHVDVDAAMDAVILERPDHLEAGPIADVREARVGKARVVRELPVVESRAQAKRRLGQVLFYADLGRTGITCDGCHIEGHTGGVFYEKTKPNRIYRSPTVLGSRDTPPFFTPAISSILCTVSMLVGT